MVSPDLLQPIAEIDNVVEDGPLTSFAKINQPPDQGFESAKIQGEEKSGNGRQSRLPA